MYLYIGLVLMGAGFGFIGGMAYSIMVITKRYKGTYCFWKYNGLSEVVGKKH